MSSFYVHYCRRWARRDAMRCVERVERASYVVSFLAQAWVEGKVRCPSARLDPDVVAISRWQPRGAGTRTARTPPRDMTVIGVASRALLENAPAWTGTELRCSVVAARALCLFELGCARKCVSP
jgi:hypothetical protein